MNTPPGFAGRSAELQLLSQCLGRAAAGDPQFVLLEGAAGIGKTALLAAFGRRAAQRERASWIFHLQPMDDGPYAPVVQAARAATNKQLYDRLGGRRRALESARALLPDWLGAVPVWGNLVAALLVTAQAFDRRRRRQATRTPTPADNDVEALLAVAVRHPLVLLLDELHAADVAATAQLERLVRASRPGTRLLLVGAYRPTPPGVPDPPVHRLIAALPAGLVRSLRLRELAPPELALWLRKCFPHLAIPEAFLPWLFAQTGGHAAATESLIARLLERSIIRFVDRRWEIREGFEAYDALAEREAPETGAPELGAIGPAVAEVLRAASLLADEFDGAALAALCGRDELYVEDQLALAAHHALIEVLGEATNAAGELVTRFRFRSPHLRAVLARSLAPGERRRLDERRAAEVGRG